MPYFWAKAFDNWAIGDQCYMFTSVRLHTITAVVSEEGVSLTSGQLECPRSRIN